MRRSRGATRGLEALAVFGLALGYFLLFVHYGFNLDDEGTLLAQFYRAYLGQIPYRDFHMGYTPAGHELQARLFELFGVSVVPLRVALAVCNATCAALLFAIARRTMPAVFAVLPPIAYVAMLPFYPGEFASFNIPYPAWYVTLFWLAGLWALLRFVETRTFGWVAVNGVLIGLCFAFKPNVGLFQLAGSALVLLLVLEPVAGEGRSRLEDAAWWLLAFAVPAGLGFIFSSQASARDVRIFLLPIFLFVLVLAVRRGAGRSADVQPRSLVAASAILGVAALAVILPWVLKFLGLLGAQRFARQILFIGTGFEQYYYMPFHGAGPWDRGLVLAALGLIAVGLLVRVRVVPAWVLLALTVLGAVGGTIALRHAPMPDGAHAALVSRLEDLSFAATLIVHWAALAAALPELWRRSRGRIQLERLVVLASALTMYLQLYPRSDFMHLVTAAPLTLVVAAGLAARFAGWFEVLSWGRPVRIAIAVATIGIALVRIGPNFGAVLEWDGGPAWRPHAALGVERAPVTLELGRGPRLQAIHDTVDFLRANTEPGEAIFPFPAIEMLCFLADRPNATRHGYFFPGWPGHEVEAEVVSALRRAPPRFVVALHQHQYFFVQAPVYYYALREFVDGQYRVVRRFGPYAVLARNDVADADLRDSPLVPAPALAVLSARYESRLSADADERLRALNELWADRLDFAWPPAVASLADADPRVRRAAVWALASAVGNADVASAYAQALADERVAADQRTMVLRRIWAFSDARVIAPILAILLDPAYADEHELARGILETLGTKLAIRDHWFRGLPPDGHQVDYDAVLPEEAVRILRDRRWRMRLADPDEDDRVRIFLARVLPRLGDREAIPALLAALGGSATALRVAAASGLLRLAPDDRDVDLLARVLPLVAREPTFAPDLVLALYRKDPQAARRPLADTMAAATYGYDQIAVAWIVSATGDPQFQALFVQLVDSPVRQLRLAAVAGLDRIGDPRARPALIRASRDPDYEVREFAERALRALPPA